ncbi:MAG: hypothetical protein L6R35_003121 [Caloplaca aegaea]|nr:MAG: hypothetical protein L6R35_003121 [Caloplaca aegaea]
MKEAIVQPNLNVDIVDSPIPVPKDNEVVIKVVVSGSNPKDWKRPVMLNVTMNSGDDIAGVVHQVGRNVHEFKPGDRVAEYAIAHAHTTFHIPNQTSFEAMTAALGLYQRLQGLPLPWHPATTSTPLIIYGAASAVGAYAIQLAQLSNIHPLICVAGRGIPFVETLVSREKGDVIVDYREGETKLIEKLKSVVKAAGGKVEYAFDAISEHGSFTNICEVLDQETGQITLVLPGKDFSAIPKSIRRSTTYVGSVHASVGTKERGDADFGFVMFRFFGRGLQEGWFRGHPHEVVPGGLAGVEGALRDLKEGKASAVKYIFRLEDTEGVERYRTN